MEEGNKTAGMCGKLKKSLYGTRDAAQNWEETYTKWLVEEMGFRRGKACPCNFYHEEKDARLVDHGDDFTILADEPTIDWFRQEMENIFFIKFIVISAW